MSGFVGTLELVGGRLLVVGLFSRLISIPMVVNMVSAYFAANREALFAILSDPGKFYGADPYTFLFAVLLVLIFGPGRFSVDAILESEPAAARADARTEPEARARTTGS